MGRRGFRSRPYHDSTGPDQGYPGDAEEWKVASGCNVAHAFRGALRPARAAAPREHRARSTGHPGSRVLLAHRDTPRRAERDAHLAAPPPPRGKTWRATPSTPRGPPHLCLDRDRLGSEPPLRGRATRALGPGVHAQDLRPPHAVGVRRHELRRLRRHDTRHKTAPTAETENQEVAKYVDSLARMVRPARLELATLSSAS